MALSLFEIEPRLCRILPLITNMKIAGPGSERRKLETRHKNAPDGRNYESAEILQTNFNRFINGGVETGSMYMQS